MSYVDAFFDRDADKISVVERSNGQRKYVEYPARYVAYYDDPKGKFKSVYGNSVSRIATKSGKLFKRELAMQAGKKLYESDVNPIFRCLEENYINKDAPELQVAFFDKTEIILASQAKLVTYVDKSRKRTTYSLYEITRSKRSEIQKRLKYTKDILQQLISGKRSSS